jgi:predicted site-specific integrase-resolvase
VAAQLVLEREQIMNEKQIYTDKEASDFLRISQVTLWRERKKGKIAFRRVASKIVYLKEDLENYLNQNKRDAFGVKGYTK